MFIIIVITVTKMAFTLRRSPSSVEDRATAIVNINRKLVKYVDAYFLRQRHKQTDTLFAILHTTTG